MKPISGVYIMSDAINMLGGAIVMVSDQQKALEFYYKKLGQCFSFSVSWFFF